MIIIYGTDQCPWCDKAKELVEAYSLEYTYHDIGNDMPRREYIKGYGLKTVPQCFYRHEDKTEHIGGYEKLKEYLQ